MRVGKRMRVRPILCLLFFPPLQARCLWIQVSFCRIERNSLESCFLSFLLVISNYLNLPLTCCSSVMITSTAMLRIPSFVWGLSVFRCVIHILPSSFRASFISRIRILKKQMSIITLNFDINTFSFEDDFCRVCLVTLDKLQFVNPWQTRWSIFILYVFPLYVRHWNWYH